MGEEVDMLTRLREFPSCQSGCNTLTVCACATIEDAADTIASLRASLTRAEERCDEAIEFIGVMRDTMVLAGYPAGDRVVLLSNFRDILTRLTRAEAEREELCRLVVAFAGPHAARYAEEFGLAPGELHPRHYDILERCGARMDDFRRATVISRASGAQDDPPTGTGRSE